ncbi:hypothetical protein BDY19DRAFT_231579 [Irpex rosettiformis]|uniref:Uncharacterized protein n=1 Tax=Irpex rosettiformis TaxID=378272 RepID=A0ACB8TZM7_9APHY|nr:hypothetical protein BDY19DRAFT_231579 [Irpex rosettiformis]
MSLPPDALPFAPPSLSSFIGPAFVMICCALILYGTFCAQAYYYWSTYHDHMSLQSVVALLIVLETAHTAFCIHILYEYLVGAWGSPAAVMKVIPTVAVTVYLELTISSIVQGWYIYRIWRLRKQIIPTVLLITILFAHMGISFRATAYINKYATWIEVYADNHFTVDLNCTFGLNIALDASIASVLIFYLSRDRSNAVKRSTRSMTRSLINFTFSTGILTVLTSCGLFIALNVTKHTLTFGGMVQFIAKLYANSMLAVLNARQSVMRAAAASDTKFGLELSNMQTTSIAPASGRRPAAPIQIRTDTTVLTVSSNTWADKRADSFSNLQSDSPPEVNMFELSKEEV